MSGGGSREESSTGLRRRVYLAGVSGVLAGVAGCSDAGDGSSDSPDEGSADSNGGGTGSSASVGSLTIDPSPVRQTRPVTLAVDVTNDGDAPVDCSVTVAAAGESIATRPVAVDAGATERVSVEATFTAVGDRTVVAELHGDEEQLDSTSTTLSVERYPASFVSTDGTDFVVDGAQFRFLGGNQNHLPVRSWGESYVERVLDYAAERGLSVIRTWGFPPAWTESSVHTAPGEFDDDWFEHFDYVIAAAKRRDVRLVVPLLNNWYGADHAPSPAAYADWSDTAEATNDFFADEQANEYFENYVEHVLTRENEITGLAYREDPTICMWEVGNEIEYHDERRGESLADWYDARAAHVKSLDDRHLVGSGMHGATGETYESWNVRNAYVESHRSQHIDACSFHDYPVWNWDGIQERGHDAFAAYVREHVRKAHEVVGKPAYFGEFGVHVEPGTEYDLEKRAAYLRTGFDVAREEGLDGLALWYPELREPTAGTAYSHESDPLAIFPDDEYWDRIEAYGESLES